MLYSSLLLSNIEMFMHQHWTITVRRSDWLTDNDMNQDSVNTVPMLLLRCLVGRSGEAYVYGAQGQAQGQAASRLA